MPHGSPIEDIEIRSMFPDHMSGSAAAIVANSAGDHADTARKCLQRSIPVLVEKPLTLSNVDSAQLVALSRESSTVLAASHIFLFASYLQSLQRVLNAAPPPAKVSVLWKDAFGEERYGEVKRYDAGLPIIVDVFPHIYSILNALIPGANIKYQSIAYARGGAEIEMLFWLNSIPCRALLGRNCEYRTRLLTFDSAVMPIALDFSIEPGVISERNSSYSGDPDWSIRLTPLTQQLVEFLKACVSGVLDPRLDPRMDLVAGRVVDAAMIDYYLCQTQWLEQTPRNEVDLDYARNELRADKVRQILQRG